MNYNSLCKILLVANKYLLTYLLKKKRKLLNDQGFQFKNQTRR